MIEITPQRPSDGPLVEQLLDRAFGPERHARPSYRLRDGLPPIAALCLAARLGPRLIGSLRFWSVRLDDRAALLLGPLAVAGDTRGQGVAKALIGQGLDRARRLGHGPVIAVGEARLFGRFGFVPAPDLVMPAPVPGHRLLGRDLGSDAPLAGVVRRADAVPVSALRRAI